MRRLATLLLVLTFSPPLFAEDIRIPVGQQGLPEMTMPSRGDSKNQVLDRFGLADEDRVISSVRHHQRPPSSP